MTRFNTGNPLSSLSEEDFYDNSMALDEAMNSTDPTWRDRFGVEKPTIDAALKSAGFMPAGFDFVTGGALQPGDRNKAVYNPAPNGDNNWYRWNGVFPKEIAANSQPNPKDENNWVPVFPTNVFDSFITVKTLSELQTKKGLKAGNRIAVNSGHEQHVRIIDENNDGSGISTPGGLFANLVTFNNTLYLTHLNVQSGEDITQLLTETLISKVDKDKITTIVLDAGDVTCTKTLPDVFGRVTFTGPGRLLSNNKNNFLQKYSSDRTSAKIPHSVMNPGAIFNACSRKAIFDKGEIRIVLLGDSISVGPDIVLSSTGEVSIGSEPATGVDNNNRHNCFAISLFKELVSVIPTGVKVKFYSRSVGGLSYAHLDYAWDSINAQWVGREQVTPGKTWRDCVLDLTPDLVIHSMGMNENSSSYISNFLIKWASYAEVTKQKMFTFDQAVVTTPNPNFNTAEQFGDFKDYGLNADKLYLASCQRAMAKSYKMSIIDVAALSYIRRYGIETRYCTYEKNDNPIIFNGGVTVKDIVQGGSVEDGDFTPSHGLIYPSINFTATPEKSSNSPDFDFKLNVGSVILQFTSGVVQLYPSLEHIPGSFLPTTSAPFVMSAGVSYNFNLTVTPQGIFLYHNDKCLLTNFSTTITATTPLFFSSGGKSGNVRVTGSLWKELFTRVSADTLSNGEMYGKLNYNLNEYGGGINHPSSLGLNDVYIPPVQHFCTDLVKNNFEYSKFIGGTAQNGVLFIGRIIKRDFSRATFVINGVWSFDLTVRIVDDVLTTNVNKNYGDMGVEVYLDQTDLSVFLKNTISTITEIEYSTNGWLLARPLNIGVITPRGNLVPVVTPPTTPAV